MMYILGPPPAPMTSCSLARSVGKDLGITINWFPSFNSQYNVERYQVAVTPDLTPSCTGSVPPNMSYTCSGLNSDTDYTITVSAINCGDQEGESNTFSVQSRLLGMCIMLFQPTDHLLDNLRFCLTPLVDNSALDIWYF
jgi:hypothetical protein